VNLDDDTQSNDVSVMIENYFEVVFNRISDSISISSNSVKPFTGNWIIRYTPINVFDLTKNCNKPNYEEFEQYLEVAQGL